MGTDGQGGGTADGRGPRGRGRSGGLALAGLLACLALAGNALATHPSSFQQLRLNIDGDRATEVVSVTYDVSSDHRTERGSVTATDTCGGRRTRAALVAAGPLRPAVALKPRQLGRAAIGITADYRGGPRVARVLRLRNCRPQVLLAFSSPTSASIQLEAREDSARYSGREVVVVEGLRDAARRSYYGWIAVRQRYVRYRTSFNEVGRTAPLRLSRRANARRRSA